MHYLPDSCHSFFRQPYTTDTYYFLCWRERKTHLVYGSCKRKLEHVETCLSTQVCLTQHPSDKLRLFLELNCRTMYSQYISSINLYRFRAYL
jgi:hypothetical protein